MIVGYDEYGIIVNIKKIVIFATDA